MLISVLVPTFNRSPWLANCVRSALRQTYPDIEVVISDNASTDDTGAIASILCAEDSRVRYYKQEENKGMKGNFLLLLNEYARGKLAIFLSDDDEFFDDSYLQEVADRVAAVGLEQVSFAFANCWNDFIDEGIRIPHTGARFPAVMEGRHYFDHHKRSAVFNEYLTAPLCTTVFNVEKCRSINGFNGSEQCFTLDLMTWLKMAMIGKIIYVDTFASLYRVYSQNTCNTTGILKWIENVVYLDDVRDFAVNYVDKNTLNAWYLRNRQRYSDDLINRVLLSSNRRAAIRSISRILCEAGALPRVTFLLKFIVFIASPRVYSLIRSLRRKLRFLRVRPKEFIKR